MRRGLMICALVLALGACADATPRASTRKRAAASSSCVSATPPTVSEPSVDQVTGVTHVVATFVDDTRSVDPDDARGSDTCRSLKTEIDLPSSPSGPLPLVLAVHGRDGDPSRLRDLLDAWVEAGYVVAAPHFLVTDKDDDNRPTSAAVARQAADASLVLDQLLALGSASGNPLSGRIDPQHIGAAGMSLGGMTVYGLVSNTCCRDRRITAAVMLAAVHREFDSGHYVGQDIPVLLVQGDADSGYHNSVSAYSQLAPPKWFITLRGSAHSPPFELPRGPEASLVDTTTSAFWDYALRGDAAASGALTTAVVTAGHRASLELQSR
jgi:dienelactone hydrolase